MRRQRLFDFGVEIGCRGLRAASAPGGATSTTISPFGGSSSASVAASSSSVPRRTVSNSLVSSRAIAALRLPRIAGAIGERFGQSARAFEKHQRAGNRREFREPRPPRPALVRQEAFEEEAVGRQSGDDQRGQHGGGAGH